MCYMTVISTNSDRDLSEFNSALVQYSRDLPGIPEEKFLHYSNKWFLGSQHQCSCGFRHLDQRNKDLGFAEPVEWWPEEPEDIEATKQVFSSFKVLIEEGAKVDCVDVWASDEKNDPQLAGEEIINFLVIPASSFRFFEGHRFEFSSET